MARIVIGGDVCPTNRDVNCFTSGDRSILCGVLLDTLAGADVAICNLETPLIDSPSPIKKTGSNFGWRSEILNGLSSIGINVVNLANNHILDHGPRGIEHTINSLDTFGFKRLGAGKNLKDASSPLNLEVGGLSVTVISYTEHEFSVADNDSPGANPLDLIDFVSTISAAKEKSNFIILLYHGGKEHYPLPSPRQQRLCRFFIDMGVGMVVCQHSHIVGAVEEYKNGKIYYGQGNFLFDPFPQKRMWLYEGFLIQIDISEKSGISTSLVPFGHRSRSGNGVGIQALEGNEEKEFFSNLYKLSSELTSGDAYVINQWKEHCNQFAPVYYSIFMGGGRFLRALNKIIPISKYLYKDQSGLLLRNVLTCETHREVAETILESDVYD